MAAGIYNKGSPLGWNKEWYHGELSRVESEQALTSSECDCFLVRVSEGALVLSLIHHGQLHHININYGRGWYELEIGDAQYTLTELEELVSHYSNNEIEGLKIKLGIACTKPGHFYELINSDGDQIYTKGEPEDLIKHSWYHRNINKEQADAALRQSFDNGFLVRVSGDNLVLSKTVRGWRSHDVIHYSPKGYHVDGQDELFKSVPEMIAHYQSHPISGSQVLGTGIDKVPTVQKLQETMNYESILFRKAETTLKIQWTKSADLPVTISSPQVVKIGDSVYAGGGMRGNVNCINYKFDMAKESWSALPPCPTHLHTLTTLNSELVAIGGQVGRRPVSTVYTFQSGEWIEVLPPMPTPRYYLAAASYNNRIIIAAGGKTIRRSNGEAEGTTAVEIYTDEQHTWYRTNPLPFSLSTFSMCFINETCYILGGTTAVDDTHILLYSAIPSLLKNTQQHVSSWRQLREEHPLCFSTSVELDERLVSLGGSSHPMHRRGTRFVCSYDFTSDTWVECKSAQLPVPLYRAGVVKLDSDQVMIVGGQPKMQQFSTAVYIGKCSKDIINPPQ